MEVGSSDGDQIGASLSQVCKPPPYRNKLMVPVLTINENPGYMLGQAAVPSLVPSYMGTTQPDHLLASQTHL